MSITPPGDRNPHTPDTSSAPRSSKRIKAGASTTLSARISSAFQRASPPQRLSPAEDKQISSDPYASPDAGMGGGGGLPPTPSTFFRFQKDSSKSLYKTGRKLEGKNDLSPLNDLPISFNTTPIYCDSNGVKHNLFTQPPGSKACWGYALLMLLSDVIRSGRFADFKPDQCFWGWIQKVYLAKDADMLAKVLETGLRAQLDTIPREESLKTIREAIKNTGLPVVVTVEHYLYGSHAIVVDHVLEDTTIVRDPARGEAWEISNMEMLDMVGDGLATMLSIR